MAQAKADSMRARDEISKSSGMCRFSLPMYSSDTYINISERADNPAGAIKSYKQFNCLNSCKTLTIGVMKKIFKQNLFISIKSTKKYCWVFLINQLFNIKIAAENFLKNNIHIDIQ